MQWKKLCAIVLGFVLLVSVFFAVANTENEETPYQNIVDDDLLVEDLAVNGVQEQLVIHENESVTVTATVTNEGDETVDVPLVIQWDDEMDVGHKGRVLEGLEPGVTENVEWSREEHGTWWPDNYIVRIGDQTVNVIVVDDLNISVENLEVNGEPDELTVRTDDPVTVTATVTNDGDSPVDIPLIIAWDYEIDEGHKGRVLEGLEPGETENVEWTREEHGTWWPDEYTVIIGTESVKVTVEAVPDILVEDLAVNGETDELTVQMDESVTVTATVTNDGDHPIDVPLVISWNDQTDEGHKGYVLEDLQPGETEDIEWTREEHATWVEAVYTVSVGEESVELTVGEPIDEPIEDEVDWDEIRVIVGLIIAAFIVGIAVGIQWMKKA